MYLKVRSEKLFGYFFVNFVSREKKFCQIWFWHVFCVIVGRREVVFEREESVGRSIKSVVFAGTSPLVGRSK